MSRYLKASSACHRSLNLRWHLEGPLERTWALAPGMSNGVSFSSESKHHGQKQILFGSKFQVEWQSAPETTYRSVHRWRGHILEDDAAAAGPSLRDLDPCSECAVWVFEDVAASIQRAVSTNKISSTAGRLVLAVRSYVGYMD